MRICTFYGFSWVEIGFLNYITPTEVPASMPTTTWLWHLPGMDGDPEIFTNKLQMFPFYTQKAAKDCWHIWSLKVILKGNLRKSVFKCNVYSFLHAGFYFKKWCRSLFQHINLEMLLFTTLHVCVDIICPIFIFKFTEDRQGEKIIEKGMLTYLSDPLPQGVCPMDEVAIPQNHFCSAPAHSEPSPPLSLFSSITPRYRCPCTFWFLLCSFP